MNAFDFTAYELFNSCEREALGFDRKSSEELCRRMRELALSDGEGLAALITNSEPIAKKEESGEKFLADT